MIHCNLITFLIIIHIGIEQVVEMDNNSKGMSRAAKRRRKESLKGSEKSSPGGKVVDAPTVLMGSSIFNDWDSKEDSGASLTDLTITSILDKVDVVDIMASDRAQALLSVLLAPVTRSDFYSEFWQNKPVYIENSKKMASLTNIYRKKDVDEIINRHILKHSEDIVLGKYYDGIQSYMGVADEEEEDQEEQATEISGSEIWRACSDGYAFHLFNLHKYNDNMWRLLSALEHEFNAPLKSHVTITSGHFVGFGPSLSDGDEFIVQVEGSELYNIYCSPGNLPASSSSVASAAQWPPPSMRTK
jgi:hypothetical protein